MDTQKRTAVIPPDSAEQEEAKLLAFVSAGLDCRETPRCRPVDEFAADFLLPPGSPRTRREDLER